MTQIKNTQTAPVAVGRGASVRRRPFIFTEGPRSLRADREKLSVQQSTIYNRSFLFDFHGGPESYT